MASEIKVSVIVPVYNAQTYLRQCLDSILNQTLREIEIICVDDGSADESAMILKEYEDKDSRLTVYRQANQYAGAARNLGLGHAVGKYVIFWDADDFFEPEALELLYGRAEADEADICVCGAYKYDNETQAAYPAKEYLVKKRLPDQIPFNKTQMDRYLFNFASNVPWNKLFLRQFVLDRGLAFQPLRQANDVYFVMTALFFARRITVVSRELIFYRTLNADSLSARVSATKYCTAEAFRAVWQRLESEQEFTEGLRQSFANKTIGPLMITLRRQAEISSYEELYSYYQATALKEFGLWNREQDFFYNEQDYADLQMIQHCNYQEFLLYQAQSYEKKFKKVRGKQRASERELKAKKKEIDKLKKRIEELETSTSYRVGRAVTYVPGKIKNLGKKKSKSS